MDIATIRYPAAYAGTLNDVAQVLVQQPLHRLQKLPGGEARMFL